MNKPPVDRKVRTITLGWFLGEGILGLWSMDASFKGGPFWPGAYIVELVVAWVLLILWLKREEYESVPYEQRWMTAYLLGWMSLATAIDTLFERIFKGPAIDWSANRVLVEKSWNDHRAFQTHWSLAHFLIIVAGLLLISVHFQLRKKKAKMATPAMQT